MDDNAHGDTLVLCSQTEQKSVYLFIETKPILTNEKAGLEVESVGYLIYYLAISRAIFIRICHVRADPQEGPRTLIIKIKSHQ